MVNKVANDQELAAALEEIFSSGKEHALVEELISGMELTVGVIGNEKATSVTASQAVVTGSILSIEEKFLPGAGENQTPAPLPADELAFVSSTIQQVYEALGCKGYARIDCFYQESAQTKTGAPRLVIIEVNTLPGITPATCIFHQAAEIGKKPMDFIDTIVQLGMQEHSARFIAKPVERAIEKISE